MSRAHARLRLRRGRTWRRTGAAARAAPAGLALAALVTLAGCAGKPVPDWQLNAKGSLDRAIDAQLSGNARVAQAEFSRARGELARTGRVDLVARAELLRCAAELAALQPGPCPGFEPLRADAAPAEQAYADHLAGTVTPAQRALLPDAQQALAAPPDGSAADVARLQAVTDPLARLVGAARWQRDGQASAAVAALAVDTASAQGWRRPLLAWLAVMQRQAEQAGDQAAAARIARRIALVLSGPSTP